MLFFMATLKFNIQNEIKNIANELLKIAIFIDTKNAY